MLLGEILDDIRHVVTRLGKPFLRSSLWLSTSAFCGQIGDVPPCDEIAKGCDTRVLCELSQSIHREQIRRLERYFHTLVLGIRFFPAHRPAPAFPIVQETE